MARKIRRQRPFDRGIQSLAVVVVVVEVDTCWLHEDTDDGVAFVAQMPVFALLES